MTYICTGSNGNHLQSTSDHRIDGSVGDCAAGSHVNMGQTIAVVVATPRLVMVVRIYRSSEPVVHVALYGGAGDDLLALSVC